MNFWEKNFLKLILETLKIFRGKFYFKKNDVESSHQLKDTVTLSQKLKFKNPYVPTKDV